MLPLDAARPLEPIRLQQVVACIDRSAFAPAVVAHAVRAACALDADLTLLQVIEPRGTTPPDPVNLDLGVQEAQQDLSQIAEEQSSRVGRIKTVVIEGDPAEQICRWVQDNDVDLTVFATHGEHGVTQWAFGSTARKLLDGVPGSLLLVPARPMVGEVSYGTVFVPLDGSSYAESVLPLATRLAADGRTRVMLAHIIPVPELTETAPIEDDALALRERLVDRNRRVAEEYLEQVRARVEGDVHVLIASRNVRTGLTAMIADEHPDLVVLSAYGCGGPRADAPFGSVADYLISQAKVPVLVVRDHNAAPARQSTEPIRLPEHASNYN